MTLGDTWPGTTSSRTVHHQTEAVMPRIVRILIILAVLIPTGGCYHATVNTGVAPVAPPVKEWKHSWIAGLVPPSQVDAKSICGEDEIARIETKLTFVNGLVGFLTASIYTPMEVTVTCGPSHSSSR